MHQNSASNSNIITKKILPKILLEAHDAPPSTLNEMYMSILISISAVTKGAVVGGSSN